MNFFLLYSKHELVANIILTLFILIAGILIRKFTLANIAKDISLEKRRRKIVFIRNTLLISIIIIIIFIWLSELKTITVSLVAIAAAVVLATKEVIMSFIGGIIRTTSKKYQVGDRIEIKYQHGDVIDISLLHTTIMEINSHPSIHMYTGNIIHIPHSVLLTEVVKVGHLNDKYTVHTFTLSAFNNDKIKINVQKQILLNITNDICSEYIKDAKLFYESLQYSTSIDMPSVYPKIILHYGDKGWLFTIRIVTPFKKSQNLEQNIIELYLNQVDI